MAHFVAQSCGGTSHRRSVVVVLATLLVALSLVLGAPAASASNRAWSWGSDAWGLLGNGITTIYENEYEDSALPEAVCAPGSEGQCPLGPYLHEVGAISAGGDHSLALMENGTVMAWGENGDGQLGDGTHTGPSACVRLSGFHHEFEQSLACSATPVAVSGLSGIIAISAGGNYSLALLSNGTVMAWGANGKGQLGDGGTESSDVPVAVSGLSNVIAISAGAGHSLALLNNGHVLAWGENEFGQLGDGTIKDRHTPVAVDELSEVITVSAGGSHSLATLSNGTVMAWGANGNGQLGDGSTESSHVPVAVSALSGATAVSAGEQHSLALLNNGTVMAWGANYDGRLGIGGEVEGAGSAGSDVPVQVCAVGIHAPDLCPSGPYLTGVSAISAGYNYSMALLSTGGVLSWGNGCAGQLGSGVGSIGKICYVPEDYSFVPVEAGGSLGDVKLISAGREHSLAFGPLLPTLSSVTPNTGLDQGGELVTITGTELSEATAVHFGSASAPSITVNSETSITAVSPPEGAGEVPVTVTTSAGTSVITHGVDFTYRAVFPQPSVKVVSPKKGPAAGGSTVQITGSGFLGGGVTVHFGSASAASATVNGASSITAVSPAGTGKADVTVTTLGGTSAAAPKAVFTYGASTITELSPNFGPASGGTSVTIRGAGFGPGTTATTFKFGSAPAMSVNCSSTTTCTAVAPAHKAGTADVVAVVGTAKGKKDPPADQFTYD